MEQKKRKYYWLKLKRDFFKRHDIRIIEDMENGKDYILFYLKLLVESIDHDGHLRFSDTIPYNDKMLSTITNTNIDVVRAAMKIFTELRFIDVMDDETIYMKQIEEMTGVETAWALKKRLQREKEGQPEDNVPLMSPECPPTKGTMSPTKGTMSPTKGTMSDKSIEYRVKEIDIDIEIDKDITFDRFWSTYPKKVAKPAARKAFDKAIKKIDIDKLIKILELRKVSDDWKKEDGQFIPHPATWLNGERWNDELNSKKQSPTEKKYTKADYYEGTEDFDTGNDEPEINHEEEPLF